MNNEGRFVFDSNVFIIAPLFNKSIPELFDSPPTERET